MAERRSNFSSITMLENWNILFEPCYFIISKKKLKFQLNFLQEKEAEKETHWLAAQHASTELLACLYWWEVSNLICCTSKCAMLPPSLTERQIASINNNRDFLFLLIRKAKPTVTGMQLQKRLSYHDNSDTQSSHYKRDCWDFFCNWYILKAFLFIMTKRNHAFFILCKFSIHSHSTAKNDNKDDNTNTRLQVNREVYLPQNKLA